MNGTRSRILFQLFELCMMGLAVVGPILLAIALLDRSGGVPDGSSLQMMGRTVETQADHDAFVVSAAGFGLLGWIYGYLRLSGRLRFVAGPHDNKIQARYKS